MKCGRRNTISQSDRIEAEHEGMYVMSLPPRSSFQRTNTIHPVICCTEVTTRIPNNWHVKILQCFYHILSEAISV